MNLFEYEGKAIFARHGINTPKSVLLCSADAPAPMPFPFVLKAQVMTGGRGKAGGVRKCADAAEYTRNAQEILNMSIKGFKVHGLLAEEMAKLEKEYYISITQQGVEVPTLIFSQMGGMDIEQVAKDQPDKILRVAIDPFTRLKGYQLNQIAAMMDVERSVAIEFLNKLQEMFFEEQALLVEINPLSVIGGQLIALDSKLVLDDHARDTAGRNAALEAARQSLYKYVTPEKEKTTVTYVPLSGDIAMISDGAGTGMLTLDVLTDMGANIACFTELGGMTTEEVMYRAMDLSLTGHDEIKGLLIVLIGGFNRMDNMARGIVKYVKEHDVTIPIITRMCGTMEAEGLRIMKQAGMPTRYDLTAAAAELVALVKEAR